MPKTSAGVLAYHLCAGQLAVFLVHPGGPFFKNKDEGAWSIPKGEYENEEDPLMVAAREFEEETGNYIQLNNVTRLDPVKTSFRKNNNGICYSG
jgi:predicted NUDIX family NTP pyrophosphohydrolase